MLKLHLQPLDLAGKACQGQTLWLITEICKLRTKKFYNIGPRVARFFDGASVGLDAVYAIAGETVRTLAAVEEIAAWAHRYKTFYGRKFFFVIS